MAVLRLLLSAALTALFALSAASPELAKSTRPDRSWDDSSLIFELQALKLKVAQLESILNESIQDLQAKSVYLHEREQLLQEASQKIQFLHSTLSDIKDGSSNPDKRLSSLEEEVRLLWAASRKNNFDLHVLQSKAKETEDASDVLRSKVEKMSDIVSERWIQIQRLEQARQMTEMRTLEARRRVGSSECTFLKGIYNLYDKQLKRVLGMLDPDLSHKRATSCPYASKAMQHFNNVFSALKKYHHELQGFIKKAMERNEVTATLANGELVFFMASAVVVLPIMTAWLWLSSALR